MKKLIAAAGSVALVFLAWYLNSAPKPDLKYQLSSPIPAALDPDMPSLVVQQIEIANVGQAPARPVYIRIKGKLTKLTILKDSEADKYEQFTKPTGIVEIVYDNLALNGRLRIILTGDTLTEQHVEVRDQHRTAKIALASGDSTWRDVGRYLSWILVIIYLILVSRHGVAWHLAHKARWSPEELLRRQRPEVFVSIGQWTSYQDTAVDQLRRNISMSSTEVSSSALYSLLTTNKPKEFEDHGWLTITEKLSAALMEAMKLLAVQCYSYSNIKSITALLSTPKPGCVSNEKWHELMQELGDIYTSAALTRHSGLRSSTKVLLKALVESKPDNIPEDKWGVYRSTLRELYFGKLLESLRLSNEPYIFMKHADLNELKPEEIRILNEFAYGMEMRRLPDLTKPYYSCDFLDQPKPEFMSEEDYASRRRFAQAVQELQSREDEVQQRAARLYDEELRTSQLKAKILRQLEIVDAFTTDPGTLDAIEDYDGAFAPRNLANLRLLGELHRKAANAGNSGAS